MGWFCQTLLLRGAIIVGLASVVTTIIYFTPVPNPYYMSCDRPCHELDWPMICRFKLTLEMYHTITSACSECPGNDTECQSRHCVRGGSSRRRILTANRLFPGPTIQVCENDIVVVDVVNRAPGQALGIHWGGQSQREFPHMDGVPQVTQCPVNTFSSFQYKFRATGAGTHLWSATGSPLADTVFGALIVKQSVNRDSQRHLYDEDRSDNVFALTLFGADDIHPEPSSILFNGQGQDAHPHGSLVAGRRNRLRLLHSGGGPNSGSITVSLEGHPVTVIALDGHPVEPRNATEVTLWPGERADVVVTCDRPHGSYALTARTGQLRSHILLQYEEGATTTPGPADKRESRDTPDKVATEVNRPTPVSTSPSVLDPHTVGLSEMSALEPLPERLAQEAVDVTLYLPFDFKALSDVDGVASPSDVRPRMCNISLSLPAAPLLTQPHDAELPGAGVAVCRGSQQPARCPESGPGGPDGPDGPAESCECAHVIEIPLGSSVEIVLADQGGDGVRNHVFHLHGHSFWVVGSDPLVASGQAATGSWEALAELDKRGDLVRRRLLSRPVRKDTVCVPHGGVVALRFIADNPGYWLLHDSDFYRWPSGLGVIFHVGDQTDLPEFPADFPKCGSFVGPEFFLM